MKVTLKHERVSIWEGKYLEIVKPEIKDKSYIRTQSLLYPIMAKAGKIQLSSRKLEN